MAWFPLAFVVGYAACSAVAYGLTFAYWTRRYPNTCRDHIEHVVGSAIFLAGFGPLGIIYALCSYGVRYGLAWRLPPRADDTPARRYAETYFALKEAKVRGDTREQGRLQRQLERDTRDLLEAERAAV